MFFQVRNTTETGLTDCHKLISSSMKSYVSRFKPKTIFYQNYKNFDKENLLRMSKQQIFVFQIMIQTRTIQPSVTIFRN